MTPADHNDPENANGHAHGPDGPVPAPGGSGGVNGRPGSNGQHGGAQGVPGDGSGESATPDPPTPPAAPTERETLVVAEGAPEADAEAVARHELTWDVERKHWRDKNDRRVCGAHPRSPKGPCRQTSLYDNGRCHHHGGPTPRGMASVHYKHGRWSRVLNPTRSKSYTAARDDPELMDLRRTLGILDVGVQEALARREELDTPDFRRQALRLYTDANRAQRDNPDEAVRLLGELGQLLRRGVDEDRAREEVARHTSRMARHSEKAWTIRLGAANAINASDLQSIIGAFIDVIVKEIPKEHVGPVLAGLDREVLRGRLAVAGVDATLR